MWMECDRLCEYKWWCFHNLTKSSLVRISNSQTTKSHPGKSMKTSFNYPCIKLHPSISMKTGFILVLNTLHVFRRRGVLVSFQSWRPSRISQMSDWTGQSNGYVSCFPSLRRGIFRLTLLSRRIYIPTFKIFLVLAKSFLDTCASVFDSSFTVFFATFLSGEDGNVNSSLVVLVPVPRFVLSWSSEVKGWIVAISTREWLFRLFMWRVGSSFFINPGLMDGPAFWERRSKLVNSVKRPRLKSSLWIFNLPF